MHRNIISHSLHYRQNYTKRVNTSKNINSKHASYRDNMGQVPWIPILSITRNTAGLCHQWFVHEITFATRFTTCSRTKSCLPRGKVGLDSVPIPEFAVYHDLFFDPFPNPFRVLVLSFKKRTFGLFPNTYLLIPSLLTQITSLKLFE